MAQNYGIRVSIPGKDVLTATDEELSLKSDFTLLKVVQNGRGTLGTTGIGTISHNLGYVPQFLVYMNNNATSTSLCKGDLLTAGVAIADGTNLYVIQGGTATYNYYLFYESTDGTASSGSSSSNNYGMKVMNTGFDISNKILNNQTFNSEKNCLKIAAQGSQTFTGTASGFTGLSITHNLGYFPGYLYWYKIGTDTKYYSGDMQQSGSINFTSQIGTQYFDLSFYYSGSYTANIYYVLFVENSA